MGGLLFDTAGLNTTNDPAMPLGTCINGNCLGGCLSISGEPGTVSPCSNCYGGFPCSSSCFAACVDVCNSGCSEGPCSAGCSNICMSLVFM